MRVVAFVDGLNLFHALMRCWRSEFAQLRRTDVRGLVSCFLKQEEHLKGVHYYTPYPHHKGEDIQGEHTTYTSALKEQGVVVRRGQFKWREEKIPLGDYRLDGEGLGRIRKDRVKATALLRTVMREALARHPEIGNGLMVSTTYKEKETDVNLVLDLLDLARRDEFDKCVIVSGDSDIFPAIRYVRESLPDKGVMVLVPPGLTTKELEREEFKGVVRCRIKRRHIKRLVMQEAEACNAPGSADTGRQHGN